MAAKVCVFFAFLSVVYLLDFDHIIAAKFLVIPLIFPEMDLYHIFCSIEFMLLLCTFNSSGRLVNTVLQIYHILSVFG